jgi:hypothetical protein
MMRRTLPPAFRARARAVAAAHAHLSRTHPRWAEMSPHDRCRAVHRHVDRVRRVGASLRRRKHTP